MKIIAFTDTHANLPALLALKNAIANEGYDEAFHTGDVLDIGPYPAECLEAMAEIPRLTQLMGNHEEFLVKGIPEPRPAWMGEDEERHYRWTCSQLPINARESIAHWPYFICREFEGTLVTFVHYGLNSTGSHFVPVISNPVPSDFDAMFGRFGSQVVFYGHDHKQSDLQGKARYVNPGPLGCGPEPVARFCVATFSPGTFTLEHRAVSYERSELLAEFERRQVPARDFILKAFYGQ
jgi:predicted phosphodiesterase